MPELIPAGKQFIVCGLRGAGKTVFCKKMLEAEPNHLIFDMLNEYSVSEGFKKYVPDAKFSGDTLNAEFDLFMQKAVFPIKNKLGMLIIEESNRVIPNKLVMPHSVGDLTDLGRHYGIKVGYITRRPVQLNTTVVELTDYMIIFSLKGKNDIQYLNSINNGLGDAVAELKDHQYVFVNPNREWEVCAPLKI